MYKELSYRMKGFRAVTVLVAVVTVVLCLVVGIGCWVLVTGFRENENIHNVQTSEKIEVEVVEGEVHEPLRLKEAKAPLNKAGRVVQHIAEIDFQDGSHGADEPQEPRAAPAAPEVTQYQVPQMIDGVVGVRIQPPQVDEAHTNYMRRVEAPEARYMKNELSAAQPAVVVVQDPHHPSNSLIEHLYNFTQDIASDIEEMGLFETLANRASEQYMRNTMQWLGDYTTQLMGNEEIAAHVRSRRSILLPLAAQALGYFNYAAFGKFMFNEVNAIAEYNMQGRKLSGDPTAEFLDSNFWSSSSPQKNTDRKEVLTAATDDWEPQVNKVSIEFIGEILNTLLNMMREYLMKDHVMECLWFMFCEDLNHQAKYADVYGFLARINR